jgi:hypothetical protein
MSLSISDLDISFNSIGSSGSSDLALWLKNMVDNQNNKSSLKRLNVAGTNVDLTVLFEALKESVIDKLEVLNIAENKITKANISSIAKYPFEDILDIVLEIPLQYCRSRRHYNKDIESPIQSGRCYIGLHYTSVFWRQLHVYGG